MAATERAKSATTRARSGGDKGAGAETEGTTNEAVAAASAVVSAGGGAVVVGEVAAAVVGEEPDISDTKLIGTLFLSGLLRRLYRWKKRGRGLELWERREGAVVLHGAHERGAAAGLLMKPSNKLVACFLA